jgi:hypothetical protein
MSRTPKKNEPPKKKKKYRPKVEKKEGVIEQVPPKKQTKKNADNERSFSLTVYVELPVKPEEKHLYPNGKFQKCEETFRNGFEMWSWHQRKKGKPKQKKKVEGKVGENAASFGAAEELQPESQEPNVT